MGSENSPDLFRVEGKGLRVILSAPCEVSMGKSVRADAAGSCVYSYITKSDK